MAVVNALIPALHLPAVALVSWGTADPNQNAQHRRNLGSASSIHLHLPRLLPYGGMLLAAVWPQLNACAKSCWARASGKAASCGDSRTQGPDRRLQPGCVMMQLGQYVVTYLLCVLIKHLLCRAYIIWSPLPAVIWTVSRYESQ